MDTTKLELQAENLINSTLSKYDFFVSKPQYDIEGCDLIILDNPTHPTRLLRIQSKGRTFLKSTSIEIPKSYVNDNFILFIYIIDNDKNEMLYIFFQEEIKQFSSNDKNFKLYCSKSNFKIKHYKNIFTKEKVDEIKIRLNSAKIKEETTLLIDSFCLENGIKSNLIFYKKKYPEKNFSVPNTLDIIKQILLCYDRSKFENRIINIYLFLTPHNFIETDFYCSEDLYLGKNKIRIFEMRIDGFVSFEIEDFLKRIINSENIILCASDIMYVPLIKELEKEKKDVVLVCEKLNNGLRNFGFNWGDILYPIAFAMGLDELEI